MNRIACLVVAALSLTIGCVAAPEEETTSSTSEALSPDLDVDPFRLTGVVANADGTFDLTGNDKNGDSYTARILPTTTFRQARLDRFSPVDPCRDLANAYNVSVPSSSDGYATINALASNSCKARVKISKGNTPNVLKSFQPVP